MTAGLTWGTTTIRRLLLRFPDAAATVSERPARVNRYESVPSAVSTPVSTAPAAGSNISDRGTSGSTTDRLTRREVVRPTASRTVRDTNVDPGLTGAPVIVEPVRFRPGGRPAAENV